jgi:succinoglycan biosynthesis protein ExoM
MTSLTTSGPDVRTHDVRPIDARPNNDVRIDVLICTFRRASVEETLRSVDAQRLPAGVRLRAIVADNDDAPSAEERVGRVAASMAVPVVYAHAPARNISIARNRCLDLAEGDYVAFIDDDERAAPDWIAALYDCAAGGGHDAVFGPALADYDGTAPDWIRAYDYHSNRPLDRGGAVQTGHTCNALLRWRGGPFTGERFLLDKGRSGGEDTEFFFRLWRMGAKLALCDEARVYEPVDPARLTFDWIRKRKFRAGQSYGRHSIGARASSAGLAAAALAKIVLCGTMAAVTSFSAARQRYWLLRGVFHCGVFTAQFGFREHALYGE